MNCMKRILTVLMTAIMALSVTPVASVAAAETDLPEVILVVRDEDSPSTIEGEKASKLEVSVGDPDDTSADTALTGTGVVESIDVVYEISEQSDASEDEETTDDQEDPDDESQQEVTTNVSEPPAVSAEGKNAVAEVKTDVNVTIISDYQEDAASVEMISASGGTVIIGGEINVDVAAEGESDDFSVAYVSEGGTLIVGGSINAEAKGTDGSLSMHGVELRGSSAEIGGDIQINTQTQTADSDTEQESGSQSEGLNLRRSSTAEIGGSIEVTDSVDAAGIRSGSWSITEYDSAPDEVREYINTYYLDTMGLDSWELYDQMSDADREKLPKPTAEEIETLISEVQNMLRNTESTNQTCVKGDVTAIGGKSSEGIDNKRGIVAVGGNVSSSSIQNPEDRSSAVVSDGVILNGMQGDLSEETNRELLELLKDLYGIEEDDVDFFPDNYYYSPLSQQFMSHLPLSVRLAHAKYDTGSNLRARFPSSIISEARERNEEVQVTVKGDVCSESTDVSKALTNHSGEAKVEGTILSAGNASAGIISTGTESVTNAGSVETRGKDASVGVIAHNGCVNLEEGIEVISDRKGTGIVLGNGSVTVGGDVSVCSGEGTGISTLQMNNRIITVMGIPQGDRNDLKKENPLFGETYKSCLSDGTLPFVVVDGTIKAKNGISYVDQATLAVIAEHYIVNMYNNRRNAHQDPDAGQADPLSMTEEQLKTASETAKKTAQELEKKTAEALQITNDLGDRYIALYYQLIFDDRGEPVEAVDENLSEEEVQKMIEEFHVLKAEYLAADAKFKESKLASDNAESLLVLYNSILELRKISDDCGTPDITAWKIEADEIVNTGIEEFSWKEFLDTWGINIDTTDWNDVVTIDYGRNAEAVRENINYIIRVAGVSGADGAITLGGTRDSHGFVTAREDEEVTIYVSCPQGWYVDSVSGGESVVNLFRNPDGSWTLIVPPGGGVEISAVLKAIEQALPGDTESAVLKAIEQVQPADTEASLRPFKVGMILPGEELEEGSNVGQIWNTLRKMDEEDPFFTAVSLKSEDDREAQMKNIDSCVAQGFGLIICVGEDMADLVKEAAVKYPDQKFVLMDDNDASALLFDESLKLTNVADVLFTADHKESSEAPTDRQVRLALQNILGQIKEGQFEGKTYFCDTTDGFRAQPQDAQ